ncbi:archease [bacterium]|nr:archease [bacterium]MBT3903783.1 archease [bacterium]MBT4578050.1 archease [bacterium]MBT5345703.1 archease [bacterium]MBT6130785.1 archease [bacterium]
MEKRFEVLPHIADIKIRVRAKSLEELFRNALFGMFQAVEPRSSLCVEVNGLITCDELPVNRTISIISYDRDTLLVDFLSEALYFSDLHNEAYFDCTFTNLSDTQLTATILGVPIEGFEVVEIKAVTYHGLHIEQKDSTWEVEIIFDI